MTRTKDNERLITNKYLPFMVDFIVFAGSGRFTEISEGSSLGMDTMVDGMMEAPNPCNRGRNIYIYIYMHMYICHSHEPQGWRV